MSNPETTTKEITLSELMLACIRAGFVVHMRSTKTHDPIDRAMSEALMIVAAKAGADMVRAGRPASEVEALIDNEELTNCTPEDFRNDMLIIKEHLDLV